MMRAKIRIDAPRFHPIIRNNTHITLTHERLPQHLDTMIDMCADSGLAVCEPHGSVFGEVVVVPIDVLADEILFYCFGVNVGVLDWVGRVRETDQTVHVVKNLNTNVILPALFLGVLDCDARFPDAVYNVTIYSGVIH